MHSSKRAGNPLGLPATVEMAVRSLLFSMGDWHAPTRIHLENTAFYAGLLAWELGLDRGAARDVYVGALVHDVGKVLIPPGILVQPGPLTPAQAEAMIQHPAAGAAMVGRHAGLGQVARLVRHHHEWMSGEGYPDGLAGEAIPLGARVIAVAEALDAMTTRQPYRQPLSLADALAELDRWAGRQFDPRVVQALHAISREGWFRDLPWLAGDGPPWAENWQPGAWRRRPGDAFTIS